MSFKHNEIVRDGFLCKCEKFYVLFENGPQRVEIPRMQGNTLRMEFLPHANYHGQKRLERWSQTIPNAFVRAQLKHYGVQYDESELSSNAVDLLIKAVAAGQCDSVPQHITDLREQMHQEWLQKSPNEELNWRPDWIMQKHFLSSNGQPDRTKADTVEEVPCRSSFVADNVCDEALKVEGLHSAKGSAHRRNHVFLGWDETAVKKATADFEVQANAADKAAEEERHQKHIASQSEYLSSLDQPERVAQGFSPVGKYEIDCEEITFYWPEDAQNMTMNIHSTPAPGLYKAQFDFGIINGVMMMSESLEDIKKYCKISDAEDKSEDEEEETEGSNGASAGSKRKASSRTGPRKQPRVDKAEPTPFKYELRLCGRETGEGTIFPDPYKGTITFGDEKFTWLKGAAELPHVGDKVPFKGYKVADEPDNNNDEWETFSWYKQF